MEDSEPETIVLKNWPEKFSDILNEIGVSATPNEIGVEKLRREITIAGVSHRLLEWLPTRAR